MSKPHALIIDDDAQNIEVLGRLLAANGVTHTAVQDTRQLESVIEHLTHVDIVFLDIEMPNHNGYEILEALKGNFSNQFPVVACTVHTNEINTAREMGFDSFIGKPLDPQLFSSQLSKILLGKPVWDAW